MTEKEKNEPVSNKVPEKYDGIYFLPNQDFTKTRYVFFNLGQDYSSEPIDSGYMGDCWQIAFITKHGDNFSFKENFEAILIDPYEYVKNITKFGIYGCVVKKTEKSVGWFKFYLDNLIKEYS